MLNYLRIIKMLKKRDLLIFEILERTAECVKYIFYPDVYERVLNIIDY